MARPEELQEFRIYIHAILPTQESLMASTFQILHTYYILYLCLIFIRIKVLNKLFFCMIIW